jgi:hypothetical protein
MVLTVTLAACSSVSGGQADASLPPESEPAVVEVDLPEAQVQQPAVGEQQVPPTAAAPESSELSSSDENTLIIFLPELTSPAPEQVDSGGSSPDAGDNPPEESSEASLPEGQAAAPRPAFDTFVERLMNGEATVRVGVYEETVMGLKVIQQPPNNPAFVSPQKGIATDYLQVFQIHGNIGLLAHNYLSGALFFDLKMGDVVQMVYGDGDFEEYEVTQLFHYQALNPLSPTSDFLDLETNERLTAAALFQKMYGGPYHLVFQTCIERDNNDTWGRLFVIAEPYE